ncbi:MAG TPA: transglutaminase domain-containing protein [Solirubrobacteraceae bacterium]|nr:transglutaminase domain-containing protein [Solirubrobacteraceae bacterium]
MSARAASAAAPARAGLARRADVRARQLAAFTAFAVFAAVEYATLLAKPPTLRVLGAVAVAAACGAALGALGGSGRAALAGRVCVALLALVLALAVLGVPLHLLVPTRWGTLGSDLRRGLDGLEGWLWPYRGSLRLARLAVLFPLAPALVGAACACFWPAGGHHLAREGLALALLIGLLMCGVVNQRAPAWRVQGLALALLLAAWLWLASPARERANSAAAWVIAATFGALVLAPLVSSSAPWLDYRSWDPVPAEIGFRWNQTYGPISWSQSTVTMLTVTERHPSLLKVISLDSFNGTAFVRSPDPPGVPGLDVPAGSGAAGSRAEQSAIVSVAGLRSKLLVTGGGVPQTVRWLNGGEPGLASTRDGTLTAGATPSAGESYRVDSYAPDPPPAVLRRAPRAFPRAYLPYASFELPAPAPGVAEMLVAPPAPGVAPALARALAHSPYATAFALARRLAAGEPTPYDIASRVSEYLRLHYAYNEHPPLTSYPLESFLSGSAGGYCQQFSGAMALLLRMDGIPARVAEGFSPGLYDSTNNSWTVRAKDAHAWVEVYFPGTGWVAFDPTPPAPGAGLTGAGLGSQVRGAATSVQGHAGRALTPSARRVALQPRAGSGGSFPLLATLSGVAAVVLLLAAGRSLLRGRRRLQDGLRGAADGAVTELRAALARLGEPPAAGCTLRELQRRLRERGANGAARYVALLEGVRYAPAPQARPTRRDRRDCRRSLASGGGPLTRLRALLALPPGVGRRA